MSSLCLYFMDWSAYLINTVHFLRFETLFEWLPNSIPTSHFCCYSIFFHHSLGLDVPQGFIIGSCFSSPSFSLRGLIFLCGFHYCKPTSLSWAPKTQILLTSDIIWISKRHLKLNIPKMNSSSFPWQCSCDFLCIFFSVISTPSPITPDRKLRKSGLFLLYFLSQVCQIYPL